MPPSITIGLDGRIELLSALLMLVRPAPSSLLPYAIRVREHFAPLAGHPAAAAFRRLLDRGFPEHRFAEMILRGPPRAGGVLAGELAAFREEVRDFASCAGAEAFFKARERDHAAFASLARKEASQGGPPEEVFSYLRLPFAGTFRFILAPLLPSEFTVNVNRRGVETRVRGGSLGLGGLTFEFDVFECCVAHELAHAALAPALRRSRAFFESLPGSPPKACRDLASWSGCIEEHLVRAITLRARKLAGDESGYRAIVRRWSRDGYPYIGMFCAGLEAFERAPRAVDFAAYAPGFIASFKVRGGELELS